MTALRLLNLRRLVQQPLRAVVVVIAVAGGVSLTLGVVVASTSVDRSFADAGRIVMGPAALQVDGPVDEGGLEAGVLPRVAAVDGVAAAIPLVRAIVVVTGGDGGDHLVPAFGIDCSIEAVLGDVGCDPGLLAAAGDVPLLPARLADELGSGAVVRTNAGVIPLDGAAVTTALDGFNRGRVVVWPLAVSQQLLTRADRLDHVLIVPEPGTDPDELRAEVSAAAGEHNVVVETGHPSTSFVTKQLLPGLLLTSLVGLFIGGQLVHTTFALALEDRRRELAVAAAVGASPRLLAAGLVAESAILGAIGGLLGTVGAAAVGGAFVRTLSEQVERVSGLQVAVHAPAWLAGLGVAVGVVAAAVAAIRPARAAAHLDLAAELSERDRHDPLRRGRRVSLILAVGGTASGLVIGWLGWRDGSIEPWQPAAALGGLVLAGSSAFRLPGALAADAVRLVRRSPLGRSGAVRVAAGNLLGDPRRTSSVANALGAAAALSLCLGAVLPSLTAAARRNAAETVGETVYVSTGPALNNTTGVDAKLPPDAEAALAAVPGVERVMGVRFASVDHPDVGFVDLTATDQPDLRYEVFRGDGWAASRAAGRVMVGPGLARRLDLDPGERFTIPGLHGPVDLTVGGIWASPDGIGSSIGLSVEQFRSIAGERPPVSYSVVPVPGVSAAELADRIRLAGVHDRLLVFGPDQLGDAFGREFAEFAEPFVALQRGMLVVGFAATLSTLLLAAVQRRRELATLAAVGMPPADLARMTLAEAAVLGLVATVIGGSAGVVAYVGYLFASLSVSGLGLAWLAPWRAVPVVGGVVVLVAIAGAAWPAWRSTRVEPALALRYE